MASMDGVAVRVPPFVAWRGVIRASLSHPSKSALLDEPITGELIARDLFSTSAPDGRTWPDRVRQDGNFLEKGAGLAGNAERASLISIVWRLPMAFRPAMKASSY
jgi:hypothetical protein